MLRLDDANVPIDAKARYGNLNSRPADGSEVYQLQSHSLTHLGGPRVFTPQTASAMLSRTALFSGQMSAGVLPSSVLPRIFNMLGHDPPMTNGTVGLQVKRIAAAVTRVVDGTVSFDELEAIRLGMSPEDAGVFQRCAGLAPSVVASFATSALPRGPGLPLNALITPLTPFQVMPQDKQFYDRKGQLCYQIWDYNWWGIEIYMDKNAAQEFKYNMQQLALATGGVAAAGGATASALGNVPAVLAAALAGLAALDFQMLANAVDAYEGCSGVTLNLTWLSVWSMDSGNTT